MLSEPQALACSAAPVLVEGLLKESEEGWLSEQSDPASLGYMHLVPLR